MKKHGYDNIKQSICDEIPNIVTDKLFNNLFEKKEQSVHFWMCNIRPMITIYLQLQKI